MLIVRSVGGNALCVRQPICKTRSRRSMRLPRSKLEKQTPRRWFPSCCLVCLFSFSEFLRWAVRDVQRTPPAIRPPVRLRRCIASRPQIEWRRRTRCRSDCAAPLGRMDAIPSIGCLSNGRRSASRSRPSWIECIGEMGHARWRLCRSTRRCILSRRLPAARSPSWCRSRMDRL